MFLGSLYGTGHEFSAGMAGFALASALNLSGLMAWMVRQNADMENQMNSVERVLEYSAETPEAPEETEADAALPYGWPAQGAISVQKLVVRYRPDLPPVLSGISFDVPARHKVGIVCRTGCGKSTLLLALYRIMEPAGGRILLDGFDIGPLGERAGGEEYSYGTVSLLSSLHKPASGRGCLSPTLVCSTNSFFFFFFFFFLKTRSSPIPHCHTIVSAAWSV